MRLPKFEYFEPKDIKEAGSILKNESSAKILAGGTDLLVNMKHRVECPDVIVNIKRISDLDYIRHDNGDIRIGALTLLKQLQKTPLITENFPGLVNAAYAVGSYHHQVMGTLAGNICQQNRCMYFNQSRWWRSSRPTCYKAGGEICHVLNKKEVCYSAYCGDMAPTLLVLNAKISLAGSDGSREISVEDFFSGDGKAPLNRKPDEILTEIRIPSDADKDVATYIKFANRDSIDFPIVGTALWASMDKKEYRVAFTAVDRKPVRSRNVEAFLNGKKLNERTINEASALAAKEAKPVKTSVYSPSHKRRMMGQLLQNALNEAVRRSTP
ncbi:MAG: FAD binding domain-containing protein [Desulfobacterales bacterium]